MSNFDPEEMADPTSPFSFSENLILQPSSISTSASCKLPEDVFSLTVDSEKYLAFQRRLFEQDTQDLVTLIDLIQHTPQSLWSEPNDVEKENIEALAYIMGRNLLAKHFSVRGVPTPFLGESLKINDCVVTIIEKAAIVFIDFVDPMMHDEVINGVVNLIVSNQSLPLYFRGLVKYCYLSGRIATLSPLKTKMAFLRSKQKATTLADTLWKELLQDAEASFRNEKIEQRRSTVLTANNGSQDLEKSKENQKNETLRVDIAKEGGIGNIWRADLEGSNKSSADLQTIKKSDALSYINLRQEIIKQEASRHETLSRCIYRAFSQSASEADKKTAAIELLAHLKARQRYLEYIYQHERVYISAFGEFAADGPIDVVILTELRIIIIYYVPFSPTGVFLKDTLIESVLENISKQDSLSEETKSLIQRWKDLYSIVLLTEEESGKAVNMAYKSSVGLNGELWVLFLFYNLHPKHPWKFYEVACNYTVKTVSRPDLTVKPQFLCIDISQKIYLRLMINFRNIFLDDPSINRWTAKPRIVDDDFPVGTIICSRESVEESEKSRFLVDSDTNDLKICVSFFLVNFWIDNILSMHRPTTDNAVTDPSVIDLKNEIRKYCINIFDACFEPERKIIEWYEKAIEKAIFSSCINFVVEDVFSTLAPKTISDYIEALAEARNQGKKNGAE